MTKIISIEGNIGSGKSTVVNSLKQFYYNNVTNESNESNEFCNKKVFFLEEPVSEWVNIKDSSGKNIIQKFYEDKEKYSFSFQIMAYISRLAKLKEVINKDYDLIICERSLMTDKNVFCKMLYDSNLIEDVNYQIYLKWFDFFITDLPQTKYIYIKTMPETAYNRIVQRNREGEADMTMDYINMCHNYHDTWLNNNSYFIDGNHESNVVYNNVMSYLLDLEI